MKIVITLICLACISTNAFSQNDGGLELYVGVSSSMLRGDTDDADISRLNSVHGGFLFLIPMTESFRIKTGLGYSARGANVEGSSVKLNYVELPLLFSFGSEKFDFFAGPQFSLLVKSNSSLDETRDFGIKYGISAGEHVFARLLFYHGFSNVTDYPGATVTNRYISLVVGFRFRSKEAE